MGRQKPPPESIDERIKRDLESNPALKCGLSAYAGMLKKLERGGDEGAFIKRMIALADKAYRAAGQPRAKLYIFRDGTADEGAPEYMFDMARERVVLVWGHSVSVPANSRDESYHKGYPSVGNGDEKGHLWAHKQGGHEGGPNYIGQVPQLNRSNAGSDNGKLWRAIEMYLAANAGLLAFVRPIYARGNNSPRPDEVEYALFSASGQFRAVVFPNS